MSMQPATTVLPVPLVLLDILQPRTRRFRHSQWLRRHLSAGDVWRATLHWRALTVCLPRPRTGVERTETIASIHAARGRPLARPTALEEDGKAALAEAPFPLLCVGPRSRYALRTPSLGPTLSSHLQVFTSRPRRAEKRALASDPPAHVILCSTLMLRSQDM